MPTLAQPQSSTTSRITCGFAAPMAVVVVMAALKVSRLNFMFFFALLELPRQRPFFEKRSGLSTHPRIGALERIRNPSSPCEA